jgi:hypothetical protein
VSTGSLPDCSNRQSQTASNRRFDAHGGRAYIYRVTDPHPGSAHAAAPSALTLRQAQWADLAGIFVPLFIVLAVIAQLADAATFTLGSQILGIRYEANGLAAGIYQRTGLEGLLLVKGSVIVLTVAVLLVLATRLPRAFTVGAAAATSIGLLGALSNASTVIAVLR